MEIDDNAMCMHSRMTDKCEFDEAEAKGLSVSEVRRRWPRKHGACPDCGAHGVHYASWAHYIAGDW